MKMLTTDLEQYTGLFLTTQIQIMSNGRCRHCFSMNPEQSPEKVASPQDGEQRNEGTETETPCVPHDASDPTQENPSVDVPETTDPKESCVFEELSLRIGSECTLRRIEMESMQQRNKAVIDGFVK